MTKEMNINDIKMMDDTQPRFNSFSSDSELVQIAVGMGLLPKEATPDALSDTVRQRMIDSYVLRDAVRLGYVPQSSTIEALTMDVRYKMYEDKNLVLYRPDGVVSRPQMWEQ